MKALFAWFIPVLLFLGVALAEERILLEDFEADQPGSLPRAWYNKRGDGQPHTYDDALRATYHYRIVAENGNRFLRFDGCRGKHLLLPTREDERIDLGKTPVLSWRWRIAQLPEGGDEGAADRNDSAAGIYVVFGFKLFHRVPKVIKYTWSSTLPVGTVLSQNWGGQKVVVVASGSERLGEWISFDRDLAEDYQRHFGEKAPARPLAILILSDADDTHSRAVADYDDLALFGDK